MPKIPVYLASVDYRSPRGDVEAAGAPGRMLAKFGEAVGEFGGKIADTIAQRAKQAQAENERAGGTAAAMASLRQTIEQFDAEANPDAVMERYREQADGIGREIAGGIGDSAARNQFDADFGNIAGVQATLLQRDMLRNLTDRARRELDDHLGLYADVAAGARHPVEHDDAVALALREIQGKADAGFITAEDAGRIEQSFYGDLAGRQTQRAIAADPQAALDSLKGGEDFAGLDADARARLTAEADRAVQAQAVRTQTEQAAVRRDTQVRLPGYLEALRDGEAPDDTHFGREALADTFGAAEGVKRWAEIEQAQRFGQAMAKVKWATPDDIAGLTGRAGDTSPALLTLRDVPANLDGLSGTDLIRHAVDRRNQQLWSKPADYVLSNPRVAELHAAMTQASAPPQPADAAAALQGLLPGATGQPAEPPPMLSPEHRRAAIAAYANGTLAEQERLGVPEDRRQVLPEDMARDAVRGIAAGDPAAADQRLRDLAADWGADWPRVLDDLKRAGLPPEYETLAETTNPVARDTLARVLATQKSEPGALRAKTGDAEGIDELVYRYKASDDGQLLTDDQTKLVKLLAYHYGQTTEPEEAVRRAIADVTGSTQVKPPQRTTGDGIGADVFDSDRTNDVIAARSGFAVSAGPATPRRGVLKKPPRTSEFPAPKAVPLYDDDGEPVTVWTPEDGDLQVHIPEGVSLNFFAEMGEADRKLSWLEKRARLLKFMRGQPWDLQRPITKLTDGFPSEQRFHGEFRDVATIAIGVYAAAADLPLETILEYQSLAAVGSNFASNELINEDYWPLPKRNVRNTELGYNLYRFGKIKPK